MSVIVSRALPDVRDGLKPVQRRILWAMHDANLRPDRPFVKCARVVGDVMANYHPHGDSSIYDALVRMGQPFSLTAPLIDKHGNFGSPADPPAASRYTECRLSQLAMELLAGIDEGTVDFEPNYDSSGSEPVVLPARFPNLLVNGSQGIAVGMATNIPPHNLAEVCNAALKLIDKPDATLAELMRIVKGPDFPTGGLIMGDDGIKDAFRTGRGTIRVRAQPRDRAGPAGRCRRSCSPRCRSRRSVDSIAGKLAELVESGKIDGVRDIRNESGQGKTRLVIELRADTNPQIVLNNLFKHTAAQSTFPVNFVALVDGVPRTMQPAGGAPGVARPPGRRRHPALAVPARAGPGAAAHRRGARQGARHDRRGREGDPGVLGPRRGAATALMGKRVRLLARSRPTTFSTWRSARLTQLGREELAKEAEELEGDDQGARAHPRQARRADGGDPRPSSSRSATRTRRPAAPRSSPTTPAPSTTVALVEDEPYSVTVTARGYVRAVAERGRSAGRSPPASATRSPR